MYAKYICQKFVTLSTPPSNFSIFLHTLTVKISVGKFESNELKEIDKKISILMTEK